MLNIKLDSKETQDGKVVYNAGIVFNIVALAVQEVEGVMPLPSKKNGISLFIEKDGIYADVSVVVKYGYSIPEIAYRIQQAVKQSVENMTHYKVVSVDVHFQDVVFEENAPVLKTDKDDETETEKDE